MRYLALFLITLLLAYPALSVELFRYRGAAKDGGTLEYVFEADQQNSPNAVTKEKAAEIAADFMTRFYHVQVGALETQELRTQPIPFWLVSDKGKPVVFPSVEEKARVAIRAALRKVK